MSYTAYGPFTNGTAPYLAAAFFNALETYLLTLSSAASDGNITSDGSGNITAIGTIQFLSGHEQLKSHTGIVMLDGSGNTDLILNAPNSGGGHKLKLSVGGTVVMSVTQAGNAVFLGTVTQSGTP